MSIKVIDEIPQTIHKRSARDMVRADIQEALDNGIRLFEFEGDYNYKTLAQTAREIAERIKDKKIREIQRRFKDENLTEAEKNIKGFYIWFRPWYDYKRNWITISSCKGDEHRRVFCKIDDVGLFEAQIIADCKVELANTRASYEMVGGKWVHINKKERE